MAKLVQITGDPGSGHSFSIKTLDPKTTFVIDTPGKGMAWAGWTETYGENFKNYCVIDDIQEVSSTVKTVSEKFPHIKTVIVDDINTLMSKKEMRESKRPGYDKWTDLALGIFEMYTEFHLLRKDLVVVMMAHSRIVPDETFGSKKMTKTNGKKLTDISLNSLLNYNLYTEVERVKGKNEYYFITQNDGKTEARSVYGVLDYKIPNDLQLVVSSIREKDLGIKEKEA